jgi:hypothetical protein
MQVNKSYICMCCHTEHVYSMYMLTHLKDRLPHVCENCGAVHTLTEDEPIMIKEGQLLSSWFPNDIEPVNQGYYRIMMPAGNVPEKLWWWDNHHKVLRFDENSVTVLHLSAIKAWRGIANPDRSVPTFIQVLDQNILQVSMQQLMAV